MANVVNVEDASYCAGLFKRSDLNWTCVLDSQDVEEEDVKFKVKLKEVFENYLNTMYPDSMDLNDMKHVVDLMNSQQWDAIFPYVENVNETYFSELIKHLIQNAKCQHMLIHIGNALKELSNH